MLEKLIIGTVQFGLDYGVNADTAKKMTQETCDTILGIASSNGITKLDTAEVYGDSMDKIGHYHRRHDKFQILSKFHSAEKVYDTLANSLTKLLIDSYHTILAHKAQDLLLNREVQVQVRRLKEEGLVKYTGVSIYTNEEFTQAIESDHVDVIQFPFNVLDNTSQRGVFMQRAKEAGKILHARSVYLQGMFLKDFPLPAKLHPLQKYIQQIKDLAQAHQLSTEELALEYVFNQELIDNVVLGHHKPSQLINNIAMIRNFKGGKYLEEIDAIAVMESALLNPRNW